MEEDFPCVECPVFAICNTRSTTQLLQCGILMRFILEDSSDTAQVGIRIEEAGIQFKRDYNFEVEDIEGGEFYLLVEKYNDDEAFNDDETDHSVFMFHEVINV